MHGLQLKIIWKFVGKRTIINNTNWENWYDRFIPWISYLGSRHKVIQNLFAPRCLLVGYSWIWRCAVTDEHGQLNSSSGLNLSFFSDQYLSRFDLKELSDGLSATYDGRPFHSFTTLCEKELCLNLDFTCFFCNSPNDIITIVIHFRLMLIVTKQLIGAIYHSRYLNVEHKFKGCLMSYFHRKKVGKTYC